MARCTLCGQEQYPFDSKQTLGKDGQIHWFCCMAHLEAWEAGERAPKAVVEEEIPAAEASPEPVTPKKTPPKRPYTRKSAGKSPRAAKK